MVCCFRDKTYCNNKECKEECDVRLTDKVMRDAEKFGLPVAVATFDCHKKVDSEE